MYDYISQIAAFITANFVPADDAETANTRFTSDQLLHFLFQTFPEGCISDYELNDLMLKLQYKRETYTVSTAQPQSKKEKEDNLPVQYTHELCTGWCMISLSLKEKLTN